MRAGITGLEEDVQERQWAAMKHPLAKVMKIEMSL
jgi:hypothetical protein